MLLTYLGDTCCHNREVILQDKHDHGCHSIVDVIMRLCYWLQQQDSYKYDMETVVKTIDAVVMTSMLWS